MALWNGAESPLWTVVLNACETDKQEEQLNSDNKEEHIVIHWDLRMWVLKIEHECSVWVQV